MDRFISWLRTNYGWGAKRQVWLIAAICLVLIFAAVGIVAAANGWK